MKRGSNTKYTRIERQDSFFINFNYTDVLQRFYGIKDEQILFIHGRASKHEHLVFGHNSYYMAGTGNQDEEQTYFQLDHYYKNPYKFILTHDDLPQKINDVEHVHVFGFSISEVDEQYLDWIEKNTPMNSLWEFSWHTEEDKKRIEMFESTHQRLVGRVSLMQLQEISREEMLKG